MHLYFDFKSQYYIALCLNGTAHSAITLSAVILHRSELLKVINRLILVANLLVILHLGPLFFLLDLILLFTRHCRVDIDKFKFSMISLNILSLIL